MILILIFFCFQKWRRVYWHQLRRLISIHSVRLPVVWNLHKWNKCFVLLKGLKTDVLNVTKSSGVIICLDLKHKRFSKEKGRRSWSLTHIFFSSSFSSLKFPIKYLRIDRETILENYKSQVFSSLVHFLFFS